MVEKVVKYQCKFPNCEEMYDSETEAKKCEDQGIIGPEIKPGFTLGGWINAYLICLEETTKGHKRTHNYLSLMGSLEGMKTDEKLFDGLSDSYRPTISFLELDTSLLERFIEDGNINLLAEKEFRGLSELVHHGYSFDIVRMNLEENNIKRLYRTHPHFFASQAH
tara:strand:+ start:913 stop:1407 length:495 start_codon:yes stop_codon:yes gene_type:complete